MKIKWFGHSAFALTTNQKQTILTDPYDSGCYGNALQYAKIDFTAEVVTASHKHPDHYSKSLPGKPRIIDKAGDYSIGDIKIKGIPTFHDESTGRERGKNTVFIYEVDNLKIAHLGDLGHIPSKEQYDQIGMVDILLVPVGGFFTIDAGQASTIATALKARIIIPMHYKTDKINFPITSADPFLKGKKVKKINTSEITIDKNTLPSEPEIWVLPYQK